MDETFIAVRIAYLCLMCCGLFISRSLRRKSDLRPKPSHYTGFIDRTSLRTPGETPLNEQSARRRDRYLHNTQQTQKANIHVLSKIRTRDRNSQATLNLRLRLHDHRDWL
jgi:hypothetical protein